MVIAIPLPFLDYHPLMQPVTKITVKKFRLKFRLFWALVIVQLLSSIVNFGTTPEIRFETMFVPIPPLWGIYAARSMVPMQFFVLFFLSVPMDFCMGLTFISKIQKSKYGFSGRHWNPHEASQDQKIPLSVKFQKGVPLLHGADGTGDVVAVQQSSAATKDPLTQNSDSDSQSFMARPQQEDNKTYRHPKNHGLHLLPPGVEEETKMGGRRDDTSHGDHSSRSTGRMWLMPSTTQMDSDRTLANYLSVSEKIYFINLLIYSVSGAAYCILAFHLYQKLGDVALGELRNPVQRALSEYGASSQASSSTAVISALNSNPIFALPRCDLQGPPAVRPFVAAGERIGSETSGESP